MTALTTILNLTGFAYEDILNPTRQTDPLDPDSDSDGMLDGWERLYGLDPLGKRLYTPCQGHRRIVYPITKSISVRMVKRLSL